MTCPNCNSQYNDNLASCPFCSVQQAPVAPQQAPFTAPQQATFEAPQGAFVAPPAPAKKKNKSALISVIIIAIFAIIGIIGAIGENKEATHVFYKETQDIGFDMSQEYTLYCKGDKVKDMKWYIIYDYNDIYADQMSEIEASIVDTLNEEYGDQSFIEISSETEGTLVKVTITFDDIEENIDTYIKLEIVESGADFLSYEKTEDQLIEDGFELVED